MPQAVQADADSRTDSITNIRTEAGARRAAYSKAYLSAQTEDECAALSRDFVRYWSRAIGQMLELARDQPASPSARAAAVWIVIHSDPDSPAHVEATQLLFAHHRLADELRPAYARMDGFHPVYVKMLSAAATGHTDRAARGTATFELAALLAQRADYREVMDATPASAADRRANLGNTIVDYLESCKPGEDRAQAAKLFHLAIEKYGDVAYRQTTLAAESAERLMALEQTYPDIGRAAPDIAGVDLEGNDLQLADFRGRVVVIVFWASWCGPCMERVPEENQLAADFPKESFTLVGVNGDRTREAASDAVRAHNIQFASWWDDPAARASIVARYGVTQWPTTYVLDARGVVRYKNIAGENLRRAIEQLIAEHPLPDRAL
jgi:thiol-disulfide isomerase/thioredoxin